MKQAKTDQGQGILKTGEGISTGMRRLARRHLDAACRQLDHNPDTRRAVHETRKSLKKLRALVRLLAPELGRESYRREMRAFRNAGRLLASLRDAEVQLHTFDALVKNSKLPLQDFAEIRGELEAAALELSSEAADSRRRVRKRLGLARKRVGDWSLGAIRVKNLAEEIRRTYSKGRKALRVAQKENSEILAFHAWRKKVKELWYHLRIVQVYLAPSAETRIAEIDAMGEAAGEVHDLAVLRETLAAHSPTLQTAQLIAAIDVRLPALQAEAMKRGDRFYAEKPADFAGQYFRAF
jgi:CHAD domain-containing protein